MNEKKQQVVVIHGGDTFDTYDQYINYLKSIELDSSYFESGGWKQMLAEQLGENYEVIRPQMPCKWNAKYLEWKIWFEKCIPFFQENTIFIGHSLGGIFLAKYFSESQYNKNIKALFLVAAPYALSDTESLADFVLKGSVSSLSQKIPTIYLYHSSDDQVVPVSEVERYQADLPQAITRLFNDRGHFRGELPEIIKDIQELVM